MHPPRARVHLFGGEESHLYWAEESEVLNLEGLGGHFIQSEKDDD